MEIPPETAPPEFTFRHVYHMPSGVSTDWCGGPISEIKSSRVANPISLWSPSRKVLRCAAFPPPHEDNSRGTKVQSIRSTLGSGETGNGNLHIKAFPNRRFYSKHYCTMKNIEPPFCWQQNTARSEVIVESNLPSIHRLIALRGQGQYALRKSAVIFFCDFLLPSPYGKHRIYPLNCLVAFCSKITTSEGEHIGNLIGLS